MTFIEYWISSFVVTIGIHKNLSQTRKKHVKVQIKLIGSIKFWKEIG